jgi:hypothetical protein
MRLGLGLLALLLPAAAARAGDPGPLCPAVARTRAVAEVELEVRDPPPEKWLARGWTPERRHFARSAATARVVRMIKGAKWKEGEPLPRAFDPIELRTADWRAFYAAGKVRALVSDGAVLEGWMADAGECNVSVCKSYSMQLEAVAACAAKK